MKTMKIEINAEQPLDGVVRELKRLGYSEFMFTPNKNTAFIATYESGNFTDWGKFDGGTYNWQLTTLAKLKEM